jgi:TRAP-type mannitol/chloroaromatic compound transport system permease large subunit
MELTELLPILMFVALALLLFSGYPVAFVLGGVAFGFGLIAIGLDEFSFIQFFNLVPRIWGGIAESLILTAIPMFIFMGTMLERSGVAKDLLHCLEVLLRRVPGGLALAVTIMGTIMAATTGIIGASVVMMTLLALKHMMNAKYDLRLATGTINASGTLGILIPPSIMLVIMADLLARSVGNLFFAAFFPGLMLAGLYTLYIITRCTINPKLAPPLSEEVGPETRGGLWLLVFVSFVPPVVLIVLVLGSILFGWTSPTEAAAVGAAGSLFLAAVYKPMMNACFGDVTEQSRSETNGADGDGPVKAKGGLWARYRAECRGLGAVLKDVVERTALTNAMLFMIFIGATAFSYVFRALGGDEVITGLVAEVSPWTTLVILMAVVFGLGFFFDWIEITLIVLPVFAPIIEGLDFGAHIEPRDIPYWFAILMAVNLQTSFLTPPFGFALFYMKGAAPPEVKIQAIYRGIVPFVLLQLVGLALVMAFPGIAMWLPNKFLN